MAEHKNILSNRFDTDESWTLPVAERHGAYKAARRALTAMTPEKIKEEVKAANIRGRGGAGFPAGVKWGFLPKDAETVYLTINADEGEPGTFKDRKLMELDPHRLIEGCIISMYAINSHVAYIYVRCELVKSIRRLEAAIVEARNKGYLGRRPFGKDFPIEIHVHPGAGAYICGEETAMLNSLEGRRGEPRLKPPFPAVKGAFGQPTVVNNVETIAAVPDVIEMGGANWSNISLLPESFRDGGTRLYGVSGHVKTPGVYEAPVGITLRDLIYDLGGGMLDDSRPLKGVIPGGSSTPVIHPDHKVNAPKEDDPMHPWHGKLHLDVPLGVDTMRNIGTMLGTCCAIVMDDSVNMAEAARNLMKFYAHESCGQCTPCREGCGWLVDVLDQIAKGNGRREDVDLLVDISNNMMGNTICALADGTAMPMLGFIQKYPQDFYDAVDGGMGREARLDAAVRAAILGGNVSGGGELIFVLFGIVAIVTAVATITLQTPLRAALSLLAHVLSLAGLYLTLHAHLLAAIQLLVYAGAVVVLFIFVIMLIGPSAMKPSKTKSMTLRTGVAALMAMVAASLAFGVSAIERPYVDLDQCPDGAAECGQFGGVEALGDAIFRQSAVPFELISVLLLVAIVAAVAVARGHSPEEKRALEAESGGE